MGERLFFVYMLASARNGTLYVGFTADLVGRVWQHRNHVARGFSDKYDVTQLVYFEVFGEYEMAARREYLLKRYRREWKISLIEKDNPQWRDLYEEIAEV